MIGRAGLGARAGTAYIDVRGSFNTLDKDLARQSRSLKSKLAGLGKAAGLALGAGVVVETKRAVAAWREAEKVAGQTAAVLKSTGGAANVTAKQISTLADAISLKAGIDDEAIQSSENLLLTFVKVRNETGKGNAIFNQATQSIVDMSVAMDQDLKSSTIQVGKALNDPIKGLTALQRVGVSFTDSQKEMVKGWVESGQTLRAQKFILAELKTEFGGSAKAQADSFDKAKVAIENLEEAIGGLVGPALARAAGGVATFVNEVRAGTGAGGQFRSAVEGIARAVGNVLHAISPFVAEIAGMAAALLQSKVAVGALIGGLTGLATVLAVRELVAFVGALGGLRQVALVVGSALIQLRTGLIGVSAAMAATGIGALVVGLAAVVGALVGLSSKTDAAKVSQHQFRDAILGVRNALDAYADSGEKVKDAQLAQEGAALGLRQAEENLNDLRKSGTATALQLKQAEHDVAVAKREVARTSTDASRAARDEGANRRKSISDARAEIETMKDRGRTLTREIATIAKDIAFGKDSRENREKLRQKTKELERVEKDLTRAQGDLTSATRSTGRETLTYAERVARLDEQIRQLKSKKVTVTASIKLVAAGVAAGANEIAAGLSGGPSVDDYVGGVTSQAVRKGKVDLSGLAGALGAPGGQSAQLGRFKSISAAMGLSAGTGPDQGYRPGDDGYHGVNRAFDSSGPAGAMMKFARTMFSAFGSSLLELIYSPLGIGIKNGRSVNILGTYGSDVYKDHFDHVHLAAQRGGLIPGVGDGDKVPVLAEPGEGFINKMAVRALGGRRAIDAINRMFPRFQGGGVAGVASAARTAGFKGNALRTAIAVAMAESGGQIGAHGDKHLGGSYGLWQIHHPSHPGYSISKLRSNAIYNAKAAYAISGGGSNWGPWTTYRTGDYRSWLDEAAAAIAGGAGPGAKPKKILPPDGSVLPPDGIGKKGKRGKRPKRGVRPVPGGGGWFDDDRKLVTLTGEPWTKGGPWPERPEEDPGLSGQELLESQRQANDILKDLLRQANLRTAVSQAQYKVFRSFPPFAGSFAGGGVVPGPAGVAQAAVVHGREGVFTEDQMAAMGGTTHVNVSFANGMEWLEKFVKVTVEKETRRGSRGGNRPLPGRAGAL